MQRHTHAFGPYTYDTATGTLWRDGEQVSLGGRATAVLGALLAAGGGVVTRESLIEAAWNGAAVEDGNLAVQVAGLRRVLGPREDGQEWIATVPRVGYRLPRDVLPIADGKPSLAVLPFINMSNDPDQEHIADGMVEDLITAFSRFRNFAVIARQSAFVYKNCQFDIRQAAKMLGVRYLLEGSVRRSADRVRVTVQLIDGTSGEHIWAEKLDGPLDDIFEFQDRVTSTVVGLIEPQLRKAEIGRARRKHPENLDAYDLYWRALALLQSSQSAGYSEAVDLLDRAVTMEPEFAPILSMAAYAHNKRRGHGLTPAGVDDFTAAVSLSERSLATDSSDPFAWLVSGGVEIARGNLNGALALARRAYDLNPNHVIICNTTAWLNWAIGNYDEAIALSLSGLRLSPGAREVFWGMMTIARAHLSAARFEEALLWGLRAIEVNADLEEMRAVIIASYAQLGQLHHADAAFADLVAINPQATIVGLVASFEGPHQRYLREGLNKVERLAAPQLARAI